jgi:hypothetical protein
MKKVPEFKNEAEECEFWSSTDPGRTRPSTSIGRKRRVKFVKLKPTLRTISVRLPVSMVPPGEFKT